MNARDDRDGRSPAFGAGIVTGRFFETWDFYTEVLGFKTWEESDERVVLVHVSGARLEILRHETEESHPELVGATDGRGLWFRLEVEDVEAERRRFASIGLGDGEPGDWRGARDVLALRDPNGVLVLVCARSASSEALDDGLPGRRPGKRGFPPWGLSSLRLFF